VALRIRSSSIPSFRRHPASAAQIVPDLTCRQVDPSPFSANAVHIAAARSITMVVRMTMTNGRTPAVALSIELTAQRSS
jgi:hypothetical protein